MTDALPARQLRRYRPPDGKYAFVSLEDAAKIAVFSLQRALAGGLGNAGHVGSIPVVPTPTNVSFRSDGQWTYATNEGVALNAVGTLDGLPPL